jgi:hypothetical protein
VKTLFSDEKNYHVSYKANLRGINGRRSKSKVRRSGKLITHSNEQADAEVQRQTVAHVQSLQMYDYYYEL